MTLLPFPADVQTLLRHRGRVRTLARRLLADENAVDDVEQETWTAALDDGPREPAALGAWLGRVAERFALQRLRGELRRSRREGAVAATADAATGREPAEIVAEADAHAHVVRAVVALDEPYRTTVVLRYFEGLPVAEVAARTQVPLETTRTRLRRAHDMLRARLERDHGSRMAVLGPLAAAATSTVSGGGIGLGGALVGTAALVTAVVAGIAGGAWLFGDHGTGGRAAAVLPAPQQAPGGGPAGAPAAPGDPLPPNAPPPRAEDAVRTEWIVRDVADGRPVPGLPLRIARRGEDGRYFSFDVVSSAEGRVPIQPKDGDTVTVRDGDPAADGWKHLDGFGQASAGVVWVVRETEVTGRVRAADGDPAVGIREVVVSSAIDLARLDEATALYPISEPVLVASLRNIPTQRALVREDGTFTVKGWLVPGASVVASAPGRVSAVVPLAAGVAPDITLARAPRVTIRVTGPDLGPTAGVSVAVVRPERVQLTVESAPDPGVEWASVVTTARRRVTTLETDAAGTATLLVDPNWETTLTVRRPGFHRVVRRVARATADVAVELALVATTEADRPVLRVGGAASGRATLRLVSADEGARWMDVGADGRLAEAGSWFDAGVTYVATLVRPGGPDGDTRLLPWTGGDIDWDSLPAVSEGE